MSDNALLSIILGALIAIVLGSMVVWLVIYA